MIDPLTFLHLSNYVTTDRELAYAATVTDRVLAACESEPEETNVSEIKSNISGPGRTLSVEASMPTGRVWVGIKDANPDKATAGIRVDRADFLRAVEGLGVIVVDRADLPEVRQVGSEIAVGGHYRTKTREFYDYTADGARETGLRLLALAEYRTHPPIDEAQVEALVSEIGEQPSERDVIRALLATGRIAVQP